MRLPYFLCLFYCLLVNSIYAQSNIIVQGIWENGPESVWLYYLEDATTYKLARFYTKVDSLTGKFNFHVPANHPTLLQLLNKDVLAFPGDTVEVVVKGTEWNNTLNFSGLKGRDHGFFLRLKEEIGLLKVYNFSFDESASMEEYEKAVTSHFRSALDFHGNYYSGNVRTRRSETLVNDRLTVSHDNNLLYLPETLAKYLLTISYYNNLLYPLTSGKISRDRVPMDYFDLMDTSLFARRELLPFRQFNIVLSYFNTCFYSLPPPKGKHYDSVYVAYRISSARTKFHGDIKNNLLLFIFTGLTENGTLSNTVQVEELYTFLNMVFKNDSARIEQIHESKLRFDIVNKPFPKEILAQRLKTTEGKYVSWGEVLSSNKVVYVDFWASWCGPCLAEMPNERKLISEFRDKGVEFVFISLDKDEEQWKKAMSKLEIEGNHYLISEKSKSPLVTYLSFDGIPRYLIINKNTLVDRDAPRPGFILNNKSIFLSLLQ